jgi:hypothetical protein
MSERSQRAREQRSRLLSSVVDDAAASLDAATPDALLAIVREAELLRDVVSPLASRATEALDEEDLIHALWQERSLLTCRSNRGPVLVDHIRGAVERAVYETLATHLRARIHEYEGGYLAA